MKRSDADHQITWSEIADLARGGALILCKKDGTSISIVMEQDEVAEDEYDAREKLENAW